MSLKIGKNALPVAKFELSEEEMERLQAEFERLELDSIIDTPGQFPRSAMVGSLGELAVLLGEGNECPEEFLFANALTVLGGIMSGLFRLNNEFATDTRLYTITVGTSGDVKKSTAQTRVLKGFQRLEDPFWSACYGIGSPEGLAEKFKTINRVVLAYDELKLLMAKAEIKGSAILPIVAQLFEKLSYENLTKNSAIKFENARLSMMANCTTDTYEDLWSHEAQAIGLLNRLLLVKADAKPRQAWPEPMDETKLEALMKRIKKQIAPSLLGEWVYGITPEAKKIWKYWYNNLPRNELTTRLDTIGFRIMPILVATTDKLEVDEEIVRVVINILNYQLHIRKELQPVDADNAYAKMEQKIVRVVEASAKPLKKHEIKKKAHGERVGDFIFDACFENVVSHQRISLDAGSGGYVPSFPPPIGGSANGSNEMT
jgi:hypothetical protein